jgi:hypothetical protein
MGKPVAPAYIISMYAKSLLYIPTLFGELSFAGITPSNCPLRLFLSKNDAGKLNPPYAVIFFPVNSIPTLLSSIVVHFDCISLFSFRLESVAAKPFDSITKGEFF